jgi:hypothetical protein
VLRRKLSKSEANPDRSLKETCVHRSESSEFGVRKNWSVLVWNLPKPKAPKSRSPETVQTIRRRRCVSEDRLVWEFDIQEKRGVLR